MESARSWRFSSTIPCFASARLHNLVRSNQMVNGPSNNARRRATRPRWLSRTVPELQRMSRIALHHTLLRVERTE